MNWEFDWLYALQQIHNPVLDKIMVALSTIGNAYHEEDEAVRGTDGTCDAADIYYRQSCS